MKKEIVFTIILFLIGLLFIYTSISKYLSFHTFINDMHKQPFPGWFSNMLVIVLPPLEILISLSLIFDKTRLAGLITSFVLMALFTIYAAVIYFRIYPIRPCSCGGVIRSLTWGQHLLFNLFYTLISLYAIRLIREQKKDNANVSVTYHPA